jgi:hypothetical protein
LRIPCRFCAGEVDVLHVGLFTVFLHRCRLGSISSSPLIFLLIDLCLLVCVMRRISVVQIFGMSTGLFLAGGVC